MDTKYVQDVINKRILGKAESIACKKSVAVDIAISLLMSRLARECRQVSA